MLDKLKLRIVFSAIGFAFVLYASYACENGYYTDHIKVFKGDVVHFKWTADNEFYSKSCTDYGTAIDQYGGSKSPAYKVVVLCKYQNKVEFIPLLIQANSILSADSDRLQTASSDYLE